MRQNFYFLHWIIGCATAALLTIPTTAAAEENTMVEDIAADTFHTR